MWRCVPVVIPSGLNQLNWLKDFTTFNFPTNYFMNFIYYFIVIKLSTVLWLTVVLHVVSGLVFLFFQTQTQWNKVKENRTLFLKNNKWSQNHFHIVNHEYRPVPKQYILIYSKIYILKRVQVTGVLSMTQGIYANKKCKRWPEQKRPMTKDTCKCQEHNYSWHEY